MTEVLYMSPEGWTYRGYLYWRGNTIPGHWEGATPERAAEYFQKIRDDPLTPIQGTAEESGKRFWEKQLTAEKRQIIAWLVAQSVDPYAGEPWAAVCKSLAKKIEAGEHWDTRSTPEKAKARLKGAPDQLVDERQRLVARLTEAANSPNSRWTRLILAQAADQIEADGKRLADLDKLNDPVAVHVNMLRGTIAKPSLANMIHLYGAEALSAALASPSAYMGSDHPLVAAVRRAAYADSGNEPSRSVLDRALNDLNVAIWANPPSRPQEQPRKATGEQIEAGAKADARYHGHEESAWPAYKEHVRHIINAAIAAALPDGVELAKFQPHAFYSADAGLTEIILKDVYTIWHPWTAGGVLKGHAVDVGYDGETGELVGIKIWDDLRRPALIQAELKQQEK